MESKAGALNNNKRGRDLSLNRKGFRKIFPKIFHINYDLIRVARCINDFE